MSVCVVKFKCRDTDIFATVIPCQESGVRIKRSGEWHGPCISVRRPDAVGSTCRTSPNTLDLPAAGPFLDSERRHHPAIQSRIAGGLGPPGCQQKYNPHGQHGSTLSILERTSAGCVDCRGCRPAVVIDTGNASSRELNQQRSISTHQYLPSRDRWQIGVVSGKCHPR